jgi:hypothetical protein
VLIAALPTFSKLACVSGFRESVCSLILCPNPPTPWVKITDKGESMEKIVVIIDDEQENLEKITSIKNAVKFTKPEEALLFIFQKSFLIRAVLTDLVMPLSSAGDWYDTKNEDQPAGILICLMAKVRRIPCAIVTAGHAKSQLEEVFSTNDIFFGIPYISCGTEKEEKHWEEALERLMPTIL